MLGKRTSYSVSLLGRLESPRTIRKVLGDSLHTFSSVRKYEPHTQNSFMHCTSAPDDTVFRKIYAGEK